VDNFIGDPNGKSREDANITGESTLLGVLLMFFTEIITLLVVEMNSQDQGLLDGCGVEGQE
jgi:uncharacterized Tic20 family protein